MSVQAWIEELSHTQVLVIARPQLGAQLATLLEQKLLGLGTKPQAKQMVDLYQALDNSTLPQPLVQNLQKVVDKWASQDDSNLKTQVAPQQLDNLSNFLTASDWQSLETKTSWEASHVLVARLRTLGVQALKESTKKVCVAILLHFHLKKGGKMPLYQCIYQWSQHFAQMFASYKVPPPAGAPSMNVYPSHPDSLSSDQLKACYQQGPPEPRFLEDLASLTQHHVPVRSTSNLLKVAQPPTPTQGQSLTQEASAVCQTMKACMADMQQMMRSQSQSLSTPAVASPLPVAATLANQRPSLSTPAVTNSLPLVATPPSVMAVANPSEAQLVPISAPASSTEQPPSQPEQQQAKSLEDFEKEAYQKLVGDHVAPASKAKAKAKTKPVPKAKPAATVKAKAMKRPAAHRAQASQPPTLPNVLGCSRCRGAAKGCEDCRQATFRGLRLPGREAWLQWYHAQKRAKTMKPTKKNK